MKRGFTLIELLAVITILAIILLIAVPIVLNVINDSKKETKKDSVKLYGRAVEIAVSNYFMKYPEENGVSIQELEVKEMIQYKGSKVECKNTRIVNREVYLGECSVGGKATKETYGSIPSICKATEGEVSTEPGTKYSCEVREDEYYNFYVLSVNEDNTVNLIMDRNICNDGQPATEENKCLTAWYAASNDNSNGPVTVMQGLYNATKNWTNVPNMDLDYTDEGHISNSSYGYGKIETTEAGIKMIKKDGTTEVTRSENQTPVIPYAAGKPIKARLPKLEEVYNTDNNDTTHCHNTDESCPAWLTNGLAQYSSYYPNNEHIEGIYGYWTLSSCPGNSFKARSAHYSGRSDDGYPTSYAGHNGLRAVITISKSDLSK